VNLAATGDRNRKPPNQSRWRGSGSISSDDFYGEGPGDEKGDTKVGSASRREELNVSKSFPLYPHNRKLAPISNTSG